MAIAASSDASSSSPKKQAIRKSRAGKRKLPKTTSDMTGNDDSELEMSPTKKAKEEIFEDEVIKIKTEEESASKETINLEGSDE